MRFQQYTDAGGTQEDDPVQVQPDMIPTAADCLLYFLFERPGLGGVQPALNLYFENFAQNLYSDSYEPPLRRVSVETVR